MSLPTAVTSHNFETVRFGTGSSWYLEMPSCHKPSKWTPASHSRRCWLRPASRRLFVVSSRSYGRTPMQQPRGKSTPWGDRVHAQRRPAATGHLATCTVVVSASGSSRHRTSGGNSASIADARTTTGLSAPHAQRVATIVAPKKILLRFTATSSRTRR